MKFDFNLLRLKSIKFSVCFVFSWKIRDGFTESSILLNQRFCRQILRDSCVKLANHWETDISEIHSIFFDILQYNSLEVLLLGGASRGMSLQTCFEISCTAGLLGKFYLARNLRKVVTVMELKHGERPLKCKEDQLLKSVAAVRLRPQATRPRQLKTKNLKNLFLQFERSNIKKITI